MGIVCCANCGHQHSGLRTGCPQCGMKPGQVLSHRATGRVQPFPVDLAPELVNVPDGMVDKT